MYEEILTNIAKHIALSDAEKSIFTSFLTVKKLRKHQYLLQAGDVCRFETFVNKGLLRAYNVDEDGTERIIMFAPEDWWISDLYSLLTETPSTLHIDALEDTEVACIEKPNLEKLYTEVPKFERFMRIAFQNAFVSQQRRILGAISQTAEERYLSFVEKYPALQQRIPQVQIASYLGITPETLSRVRKGIR
ncbi:MAG TPA: Crp/Fnr family transcriptional regulator [Cyclobacteriaceae bacterium]|nr:Crp/Fnr family transcriptional regulator [Cyclobacteriaceae bacterium]